MIERISMDFDKGGVSIRPFLASRPENNKIRTPTNGGRRFKISEKKHYVI